MAFPQSSQATTAPTMQDFWLRVLGNLGLPSTQANLDFLQSWAHAEDNTLAYLFARNNPLATTQASSGATNLNSAGVKIYPNWQAGADATSKTLSNGLFPNILSQLSSGSVSISGAVQRDLTNWSSGPNNPNINTSYVSNIANYLGQHIASIPTDLVKPFGNATVTTGTQTQTETQAPTSPDAKSAPGIHIPNPFDWIKNQLGRAVWFIIGMLFIIIGIYLLAREPAVKIATSPEVKAATGAIGGGAGAIA